MNPMAFLKESCRREEDSRVLAYVSTSTSRRVPLAARCRRNRAAWVDMLSGFRSKG